MAAGDIIWDAHFEVKELDRYFSATSGAEWASSSTNDSGFLFPYCSGGTGYMQKDLDAAVDEMCLGWVIKHREWFYGGAEMRLLDASDNIVFHIKQPGRSDLWRGVQVYDGLSSGSPEWAYCLAPPMDSGGENYFDLFVKRHASTGHIRLYMRNAYFRDTMLIYSFSGDTSNGASIAKIMFRQRFNLNAAVCIEGTPAFLPSGVLVQRLDPTSDGSHTDLTPSAGPDHYAVVADELETDTADYLETNTPGEDTFGFENMVTTDVKQVRGVILNAHGDQQASTTITGINRRVVQSSTDYDGTAITLINGGGYHRFQMPTSPDDSNPWTTAKVNALEAGVKLEA